MSESLFSSQSRMMGSFISSLLATLIPHNVRVALIYQEHDIASLTGKFDYLVIAHRLMGTVENVEKLLTELTPFCTERTRILILWQAWGWRLSLRLLRWMRLVPQELVVPNGFSARDVQDFLSLAGYETITIDGGLLFPWKIPLVSWLYNSLLGSLPGVRWFGLLRWAIARPAMCGQTQERTVPVETVPAEAVTVVIPCRNERGNIERAVKECPQMQMGLGARTEIIFVEGGSSDGTLEEIYRVQKLYPERDIKVLKQTGKGKRDAVELGFAHATGDILMILDADLTVVPQDLVYFYRALIENKGEFINGSRLVYPMEKGAMQRLNFLVNHIFSWKLTWLLGQRVTDTLCGTKVLYRRDYERMRAEPFFKGQDPFGDFDLLFGAAQFQLKIVNLPIRYRARSYGTTQIGEPWSWKRFAYGWVLLKLCWIGFKKLKVRS